MPIYVVQCNKCEKQFEQFSSIDKRHEILCECGGDTKLLIPRSYGKDWFRAHINEDFDGTPIHVESRGQYKELCKKHGVQARCLL